MAVRDLKYGFGTHATNLCSALADQGVETSLFVGQNDYVMAQLGRYLSNDYKDHDLLHVHGTPYLVCKQPIPTVVTVHSTVRSELLHNLWRPKFWVGRVVEKLAMLSPDAFIAVNSCLIDDILYDRSDADITVIPNGVYPEEFDQFMWTEPKENYILTGGRLVKRKRFLDVFKARDGLDTETKIILFGDGPDFRKFQRIKRGTDYLVGWVERDGLIGLYLNARMFVSPSSYEAGPLTVLEAMAARCPVISSDIPAVKDMITNGETGLLYPVGDIEKLSEQIKTLIEDPELGIKLAENAHEYVRVHHNWADVAKATIGVYEMLLGRSRK